MSVCLSVSLSVSLSVCPSSLGLSLHAPRLLPVDPDQQSPFESLKLEGALVAGPGDTVHPEHEGVLIGWEVGCGNVLTYHMKILETLEVFFYFMYHYQRAK